MIKLFIIDDDAKFAHAFQKRLTDIFSAYDTVTCDVLTGDFDTIKQIGDYDFVFLDIDLAETTGLAIAKHLRSTSFVGRIVFVSAHDNFVHQSLALNPYYFIRKGSLNADVTTFRDMLKDLDFTRERITLTSGKVSQVIPMKSIIYIESLRHVLYVHTTEGVFKDTRPLQAMLEELNGSFAQIHKSFIVNHAYVERYNKTYLILKGGGKFTMGRIYYAAYDLSYKEYMLEWSY